MRLILAPMQGVVDYQMRELLTGIGSFDRCVTEFIRVTNQLYPHRVFYRYAPELHHQGCTRTGTPVYLQLLGGSPIWMAANAARAAKMGAPGIDLNFGCPAKLVNRNDGGSILLKQPQRIAAIVAAVRDAVMPEIPVTVKMRLGFADTTLLEDVAAGAANAGASELCIHARTREDGYKPPAFWHYLRPLTSQLNIPVIANGEIWSVADALAAQSASGCQDLMLGRGALACPDLARQIKGYDQGRQVEAISWTEVLKVLEDFFERCDQWSPGHVGNRTKQWLSYLQRHYAGAAQLFTQIKRLTNGADIQAVIAQQLEDSGVQRRMVLAVQ